MATNPVVIDLDHTFSGTSPAGYAPWVEVACVEVAADTVLLTVRNSNLTGDEFNSVVYLNFNPSKDVTLLNFTYLSGTTGLGWYAPETSADAYKTDGDGFYDIKLCFNTENHGRFLGSDFITFQITSTSALSASDFAFSSVQGGGTGIYYAAAQIQGIGGDDSVSGWIGATQVVPVPEPASITLLAIAGAACWRCRRRAG